MLQNYLKIAWRTFTGNKGFTVLSVLSLSIAITSVLLIGLFVWQEFSYDSFHERPHDIYRLVTHAQNQDSERSAGFVPLALAPYLAEQYPGVENYARVWEYRRSMPVANPGRNITFYEGNFAWAEDRFFDLFDFQIIAGDTKNPLGDKRGVVISEAVAEKYYADENPIGKPLHFRGEIDIPLHVTAVMADFPPNSHFHFDFVANIRTAAKDFWAGGQATEAMLDEWVNLFVPAYIMTAPGTDLEPILNDATRQVNDRLEVPGSAYRVEAQRLTDIHLTSNLDIGEFEVNGSRSNVYAVMIIGLIVLVLGCFNFVNLVTARAGTRTREIGLRKAMGGNRLQLIIQQFLETFLLVLISLAISLGAAELLSPGLEDFIRLYSPLELITQPIPLAVLAGFILLLVILAGTYPALYLTGFSPSSILRETFAGNPGGGSLRKVLVTIQFALGGALIVCTMVVYQQLEFMKQKELGFAEEQILVIPIHRDNVIIPNFDRVKEAFLQDSNIKGVTASSHLMFATFTYSNTFSLSGSEREYRWERYTVEADYPEVYGLEFVAGRSFRRHFTADSNAVILNEQAVRELGIIPEEVVGRTMENRSIQVAGEVVGVVRDFHFQSMHERIQPFVLVNRPEQVDFISVRINPEQVSSTVDFLETTWKEVIPEASFGYYFLDNTFGAIYSREERLSSTVLGFSVVAVFLACLGLFGLALFTAELRTKEIGVRKVLGATVWDIVRLLTGDFTRLVILALLLALPVSYILMNNWLNNYAYRIEVSWSLYLSGALLVLVLSWLTVSWHSIRAASANPVNSLKRE